jgi:hypothetical protein
MLWRHEDRKTKTYCLIISFVLLLVILSAAAYMKGRRDVLLNEFKTYELNTVLLGASLSNAQNKVLYEFMKSRYYYIGNRVPSDWLPLREGDKGPVDTNLVKNLMIGKGPTTADIEYGNFKAKYEKAHP